MVWILNAMIFYTTSSVLVIKVISIAVILILLETVMELSSELERASLKCAGSSAQIDWKQRLLFQDSRKIFAHDNKL